MYSSPARPEIPDDGRRDDASTPKMASRSLSIWIAAVLIGLLVFVVSACLVWVELKASMSTIYAQLVAGLAGLLAGGAAAVRVFDWLDRRVR